MPRLIINADDLGLTHGVNRAIVQAREDGIVTSATLMANAPAFADAVTSLLRLPAYRAKQFGVGCHVVLVDGVPLSPPSEVGSLLDSKNAPPSFNKKLWKFALAAMRRKISANEVEAEASAQISKLQQAGIEVSHVDCHKHAHVFPVVLEGLLRAAKARGVPSIRNPFEPAFARPFSVNRKAGMRPLETAMLKALYAERFLERVREFGLSTTEGSLGVTITGTLNNENFLAIIRNLPKDGTYEFVCHPGYNDGHLASAGTKLLQSRETELEVLCSPTIRQALQDANIEMINFWDLPAADESNRRTGHPIS